MPSKLSEQIVATVLAHVGVRSNEEARHDAAVNVDALLWPTTPATPSDSARRAAEEIASLTYNRHRDEKIAQYSAIISKYFAAAPADNDAELLLSKAIAIVEGTRNSSLWNCDGYPQALTDTVEKLRALTTTKGDR